MIRERAYNNLKLDRVLLGTPAAKAAVLEAQTRGANRVVVVTPQVIVDNTPIIAPIVEALGDKCVGTYTDLVDHVPRASVFRLAAYLRETKADLIITVGGGTPMDTVKVALICLAENITTGEALDKFAVFVDENGNRVTPAVSSPPLRQVIIPTTLSGAEFSDLAGCVDTETQVKQLFSGPEIGSASVILDPSLSLFTPPNLWLSTGVRAIDHAVETLCSSEPEAVADAGALHALRLFGRSLPLSVTEPDNLDARLECQTAVWLACAGLNRVPYGASHGIGHQLGAVSNVPHGYTSCVMLPHVMAFNEGATSNIQKDIAQALGRPGVAAGAAVADLISSLGMPTRLRDVGVKRVDFDAIARGSILNAWVRGNVRPINEASQVIELLEQAF